MIAATSVENLANFSERAASTRPSHGMVRSIIITSGLQEKKQKKKHMIYGEKTIIDVVVSCIKKKERKKATHFQEP